MSAIVEAFVQEAEMATVTVLTPTGTLGYGFGSEAFAHGLDLNPDVIAVDAGSTDPGPYYLGSGEPLVSRFSTKKELSELITAARRAGIPVVIGSAGGSGSQSHVDWTAAIVREIARENDLSFKLARIYADVPKARVAEALSRNEIKDFEAGFALSEAGLEETDVIVAQMGHEPIVAALREGADVVVAGRACDDCAIAAYPIYRGADRGSAIHMGKILECGAFSAEPFAMDVMVGELNGTQFTLVPGSSQRKASIASVAAHSLYERENPFSQAGPGHRIDLSECHFEQLDPRRVRVRGARYREDGEYWVKLEGVRRAGYRTLCIGGVRCPTMIARIDEILATIQRNTLAYFGDNALRLKIHVYGRDGVMGPLEPERAVAGHELGLVIDAVAPRQDLARGACHHASGSLLHHHYDGQFNTSGNIAFLYSPSELDCGPAYEFSIYHLIKLQSPTEIFPVHMEKL